MADELDPVEQQFIADVQPYVDAVESAARDVRDFADANLEATTAVDDMRDHAAETGAAVGDLRDHAVQAAEADRSLRDSAAEAAEAMGHERDEALAAAAAAGIYADKVGNLHEANGRFVTSARKAELGLTDIKDGLEGLVREADKVSGGGNGSSGGLLQKILFGGNSGIASLGTAAGEGAGGIPLLGAGGLGGLAAAIPVIYAAVAEVTALASGFAAAGAGAGAFALLAIPAFDKVKNAYTGINTAQAAYHKAQLTEQMDPTKAHLTAVQTALLNLREAWTGLTPAEAGAVHGIQDLMDTYHKMAKAFEPDAFKIFNDGLRIANELLPQVTPFANIFANSLDGLLKGAAGFFKVSTPVNDLARGMGLLHDKTASTLTPFGQWLSQMRQIEGPSIHAIGEGVGHVATAIGKLLTTMSAKDVVNGINIAFSIIAGTINTLTWIVTHLMHSWDELTSGFSRSEKDASNWAQDVSAAFDRVRHDVADWDHNVAAHFDEVRHDAANLAHNIASYFDEARANISRWASDVDNDANRVAAYFRALPGRILAELEHLVGDLTSLGRNAVDGFLRGVESAAGGLLSEVSHLASDVSGAFSKVLGILSPSRVFYEHAVNTLQGYINGVKAKAPELVAAMRQAAGQVGATGPAFGGAAAGTASGSASAPAVHVTVPVALGAGTTGYNSPQFLQYLQGVVQEAVLRYTQVNPSNGLSVAGKLS